MPSTRISNCAPGGFANFIGPRVIEALDVIEHIHPGFVTCPIRLVAGALGLERGEDLIEQTTPLSAISRWNCSLVTAKASIWMQRPHRRRSRTTQQTRSHRTRRIPQSPEPRPARRQRMTAFPPIAAIRAPFQTHPSNAACPRGRRGEDPLHLVGPAEVGAVDEEPRCVLGVRGVRERRQVFAFTERNTTRRSSA